MTRLRNMCYCLLPDSVGHAWLADRSTRKKLSGTIIGTDVSYSSSVTYYQPVRPDQACRLTLSPIFHAFINCYATFQT